MTVCVNYPCERCKNYIGLKDGWDMICKAFPDGIPGEFFKSINAAELPECANGYKYEYDESRDIFKILEKMRKAREQSEKAREQSE